MISMDFLTRDVSGLEFMEFQDTDFYKKLSTHLEGYIDASGVLSKDCAKGTSELIAEYCGFKNIKFTFQEKDNLAVDVAYFSPNHVLNNPLVDELLKSTNTTLYRWFKQSKEKVFKGTIDYRTGKVAGSFETIPVELFINKNLNVTFPNDKIDKFGVPLAGVLAGAIAHEMGHVFGGCMMLLTVCSDDLLAKSALRHYKAANLPEERVMVLRDVASLLEVPEPKLDALRELAQNPDEQIAQMYFNKLLTQRNTQRSLSVGVERMSSEVIADMYAIRMGCDKGVIAAIGILVDHGCIKAFLNSLLTAVVFYVVAGFLGAPFIVALSATGVSFAVLNGFGYLFLAFMFVTDYFGKGYSGAYNADHRRFDDAVRQMIAKVKEDKRVRGSEKAVLVKEVEHLLEINKQLKPWWDNTVIHRMMGWVFSQGDFKLVEVEHYTSVLANHELNLLSGKLSALKARRDPDNIEA